MTVRGRATGLLVALLWLAAVAPIPLQAQSAGSSPIGNARGAYRAGRYTEALEWSRQASGAAPSSVEALVAHGALAEFMGEFDEAQQVEDRALQLEPRNVAALYRRASLAVRVGEYDRALDLLDRIIATHPTWARAMFTCAPSPLQTGLLRDYPTLDRAARTESGLVGLAVRALPVALRTGLLEEYPFLAFIVELKIDVLMEKGDLDGARRLARGYGVIQVGRDYCREVSSEPSSEGRFRLFRLAALAQPDNADCIWWYGQWLSDEGFVRLGRVMVIEGTRLTASQGNKDSGVRYLQIRLSGGREIAKRVEQLALIGRQRYVRDGDSAGATRLLEEAVRIDPGFARPYDHLARIAWDRGDREGAVAWLERGVAADSYSWRTRRNLGKALDALARYPEAERHLRRTVELFGDDVGGHLALARVLYAQGRYDEYARETRWTLGFARQWKRELTEVETFLAGFEQRGPGQGQLPPSPDPTLFIGWNVD
jgi:tetratricopeptide (TPR) repeat protein